MKCHSTAVNANGFVLQFSFVQKGFKTKQPEVQKIEANLQRFSLKSGVNFKPRFEISFGPGKFLSPCSVLTSSSLLLGIMVWAVGTGMAIAMLLDVQVHHLHLQLQQLLTPPLLVLRSTLFLSLGRLGQNLPGSRIWGSQSGHPHPPHPDGPLQLFLLLLPPLPLCCSNCCSCCYSGCSAAAARLTLEQPLLENKQDQLGFSLNHCILRSVPAHPLESGIKNSAKWSKVT